MKQSMVQGAVRGAALGGLIGGTLAWIAGRARLGLRPAVFLASGAYAGAVYGGIMGAVGAARQEPIQEVAGPTYR